MASKIAQTVIDSTESAIDRGAAWVANSIGMETWQVETFVLVALMVMLATAWYWRSASASRDLLYHDDIEGTADQAVERKPQRRKKTFRGAGAGYSRVALNGADPDESDVQELQGRPKI